MTAPIAVLEAPKKPTKPRFSLEIHGVRGIALSLVVAFHLFGDGRVSGGVDVFLVISAYLLVGSLDRALSTGTFSLATRYARTFARLLPAALMVIALTGLGGLLFFPQSRLEQLFREVTASALLSENIELATTGLSYGAAGRGASPLQHFWSLSMQGQFLLLLPLVALLLAWVLRAMRLRWSTVIFGGLIALVSIASFIYAIEAVAVDQQVAYYSLRARFWEMGLGGLVALIGPRLHISNQIRGLLGWIGLTLILSSGFVIDGLNTFPGPQALWPVGGALAVLISAGGDGLGSNLGFTRAVSAKPVMWLADVAYPLYLWHWPILVYFLAYMGQIRVGILQAAGILAVSLALSHLTQRYVIETVSQFAGRVRERQFGALIVVGALVVASVLVALFGSTMAGRQQRLADQELAASADIGEGSGDLASYEGSQHPGAAALIFPSLADFNWEDPVSPSPAFAEQDLPPIYDEGCVQNWRDGEGLDEVLICEDSPGTKRVVLSGGSHAVQYYTSLREIADEENWELIVVDKDACRLAAVTDDFTQRSSCVSWNEDALPVIIGLEPDAVFTVGTQTREANPSEANADEAVVDGQVEVWEALGEAGISVIGLRDTPRSSLLAPQCLETSDDWGECSVPRDSAYAQVFPMRSVDLPKNVFGIDTSDFFCSSTLCEAVTGNVVTYRDASHFTASYARTMTPFLKELLQEQVPFLFE